MSALTYERALNRLARDLAYRAHCNYKDGANNQWEGVHFAQVARTLATVYGLPVSKVLTTLETTTHELYCGPTFKV